MPKLEILTGKAAGSSFDLKAGDKNNVGNRRTAAINIKDPNIAFDHAVIYEEASRWWIKDAGSKNGTFVNGVQVVKGAKALEGGETIKFGEVEARFHHN